MAVALATAAVALGAALPGTASAQRVIEETLILRDPTVAAPNKWLVGGAVEYWYITGDYTITANDGTTLGEGDIKYTQPGWNAYAGYGDFTLFFTSRSGDGDLDITYGPNTMGVPVAVNTKSTVEQEDREISLRWIFLKRPHFAPYAVVGYSWTDYEQEEVIQTPGITWTATGNNTRRETIEYTAPFIGGGAIIPINDRFGVRAEARVKFYDADRTQTGLPSDSGSGIGGDATVTGYVNIIEGLNLQLGGRWTHLDAGDAGGTVSRWGWFAMLGYVHRF